MEALIDSSCTHAAAVHHMVKEQELVMEKLKQSIGMTNADGLDSGSGKVTDYILMTFTTGNRHTENMKALVANIT